MAGAIRLELALNALRVAPLAKSSVSPAFLRHVATGASYPALLKPWLPTRFSTSTTACFTLPRSAVLVSAAEAGAEMIHAYRDEAVAVRWDEEPAPIQRLRMEPNLGLTFDRRGLTLAVELLSVPVGDAGRKLGANGFHEGAEFCFESRCTRWMRSSSLTSTNESSLRSAVMISRCVGDSESADVFASDGCVRQIPAG